MNIRGCLFLSEFELLFHNSQPLFIIFIGEILHELGAFDRLLMPSPQPQPKPHTQTKPPPQLALRFPPDAPSQTQPALLLSIGLKAPPPRIPDNIPPHLRIGHLITQRFMMNTDVGYAHSFKLFSD